MIEDLKKCKSVKEYLLKQLVPQLEETAKTIAKIKKQIKEQEDKIAFYKSLNFHQAEEEMKKFNSTARKAANRREREEEAENEKLAEMKKDTLSAKIPNWERDFERKIADIGWNISQEVEKRGNEYLKEYKDFTDPLRFTGCLIADFENSVFNLSCVLLTEESKLATIQHNIELTKKHF